MAEACISVVARTERLPSRRRGRRPAGDERDGLRHASQVLTACAWLVGPVPADDLDALYRVLGACPGGRANVTLASAASPCATVRRTARQRCSITWTSTPRPSPKPVELRLELAPRTQSLLMDIACSWGRTARQWFHRSRAALVTAWRYRGFLAAAVRRSAGAADVPVLDATAIGMSFVSATAHGR
ncbi:MAG: hypothetical protein ACLT98_08555 [Eggerthellaceae bacterium]